MTVFGMSQFRKVVPRQMTLEELAKRNRYLRDAEERERYLLRTFTGRQFMFPAVKDKRKA